MGVLAGWGPCARGGGQHPVNRADVAQRAPPKYKSRAPKALPPLRSTHLTSCWSKTWILWQTCTCRTLQEGWESDPRHPLAAPQSRCRAAALVARKRRPLLQRRQRPGPPAAYIYTYVPSLLIGPRNGCLQGCCRNVDAFDSVFELRN